MRILLELALLIALALLASGRHVWVFRRTRSGAALFTGGWLMILVGMLIGPHGIGLIRSDRVILLYPLLLFMLGWVGLLVGLQADRRIAAILPLQVTKVALIDAAQSLVATTAVALVVLVSMLDAPVSTLWPLALLLGICSISWSPEVRSLQPSDLPGIRTMGVVRASAGVGSMLMLILYALLINSFLLKNLEASGFTPSLTEFAVGVLTPVAFAVAMGAIAFWVMHMAENDESQLGVVLLGTVCLTAGGAAMMGYLPLLFSMLAGAVLANLHSNTIVKFKRRIIVAEQPVAMILMLAAGVLTDPRVLLEHPALVGVLIGCVLMTRLLIKLVFGQRMLRARLPKNRATPFLQGLLRQNPLAIAVAVGFAISSFGRAANSPLQGSEVVTVVILIGLISELGSFFGHATQASEASPSPGVESTG